MSETLEATCWNCGGFLQAGDDYLCKDCKPKAEEALDPWPLVRELRDALDQAWASLIDRLLAKGPLSKEYAAAVSETILAASARATAALERREGVGEPRAGGRGGSRV